MQFSTATISLAALSLSGMATAKPVVQARADPVVAVLLVEASHGGAGSGLTNTTINVPFNTPFSSDPALQEVSSLYVVGSSSETVPVDSITCQTFGTADASGHGGRQFWQGVPSRLSTNTVVVPSIVCESALVGNFRQTPCSK